MKYYLFVSMVFYHVGYGMQEVTTAIFNAQREDFKTSVHALYKPILLQSYIPNFIKKGFFSVCRVAPIKQISYSDEEAKFASILQRFFAQESDYESFINNFNFNLQHQIYMNNLVADLELNDSWSESELISEFRKELINLCNVDKKTSIEELCAIANDSEQMDYDIYMTCMTLNLFVRYWLQKQRLI